MQTYYKKKKKNEKNVKDEDTRDDTLFTTLDLMDYLWHPLLIFIILDLRVKQRNGRRNKTVSTLFMVLFGILSPATCCGIILTCSF